MPFSLGLHPQGDGWCLYELLGQGCKPAFHFLYIIHLNNQHSESTIRAKCALITSSLDTGSGSSLKKMTGMKRLEPLGMKCHNHTCQMQGAHEVDTSHSYSNHVGGFISKKIQDTYYMFYVLELMCGDLIKWISLLPCAEPWIVLESELTALTHNPDQLLLDFISLQS